MSILINADYINYLLANGSYLYLSTSDSVCGTSATFYPYDTSTFDHMYIPIYWGAPPSTLTDDQLHARCYVTSSNGVLTNVNEFYFPDFDDVPAESAPSVELKYIHIVNGNTTYRICALDNPITVSQGKRPCFEAGSIQLTTTVTEVTS